MLLQLACFLLFTPASVLADWDSNLIASSNPDDLLEKGVLFHERGKILLAEKFVPVEFMIPFPTYDFSLKTGIENTITPLSTMWDIPSIFCPLNFSSNLIRIRRHLLLTGFLYKSIRKSMRLPRMYSSYVMKLRLFCLRQPRNDQPAKKAAPGPAQLLWRPWVSLAVALLLAALTLVACKEFLEPVKTSQRPTLRTFAVFQTSRMSFHSMLPNFPEIPKKNFFSSKTNWPPSMKSKRPCSLPKTKTGHSLSNNLQFLNEIFTSCETVTKCCSRINNLILILTPYRRYSL